MHTSMDFGGKMTLKMTQDPNLSFLWEHMRNCHIQTFVGTTWKKKLVHYCIYIEIISYYKSIRVDERDLSHMV